MNTALRLSLTLAALLTLSGCASGTARKGPDAHRSDADDDSHVRFVLSAENLPHELSWKCDPQFADVNGDGHADLLALSRLGGGPQLWLGDGRGNWTEHSDALAYGERSCGGGIAFADVSEDGQLDIVVGDHCQGIFVYLGDGAGNFEMVVRGLFASDLVPEGGMEREYMGVEDIAVGDVDRDGHLDLVTGASDSAGFNLWLGDGTGKTWIWQPTNLPQTGWSNRVELVDMNDDGNLDLVASYCKGPRIWLGDGSGNWAESSAGMPTPMTEGLFMGLATGDVNGDGRRDVVVSNWIDGPEAYFQQADGSWQKSADVFPEMRGGAYGLALADIDQDGNLDILCTGRLPYEVGYVYGAFFLRGDGKGGWSYLPDTGLPDTGLGLSWGIGVGDVDNDGVLDVAAGSGGKPATNPEYGFEPKIKPRLLFWLTRLKSE